MASSDSRSNRSLWSACGINIRRRLFLCSPEVAHCMRLELRYCTHTTLFVQSRGHSLHWGLSWGIAHTRLFLCSPEVAHCTGGWAEVLRTHNSFCAVQRSFVVLGPAAIHRRNHAASFSLVLSIALTLHTFLSCTPKKKNMGSLNYVCTCLWDEHGLIPRPRFHSLGTGEDSGGLLVT